MAQALIAAIHTQFGRNSGAVLRALSSRRGRRNSTENLRRIRKVGR